MKTKRYTEKATVELIWQIENSIHILDVTWYFKGQGIYNIIYINLIWLVLVQNELNTFIK